jgi:HK97 family phage major capsid protein
METNENKDIEVKDTSVEDAKSIGAELANTVLAGLKAEMADQKAQSEAVAASKIVKSNSVKSEKAKTAEKMQFHGKLTAYKSNELEQAYDDGMWYKATQLGDIDAQEYCVENGIKALGAATGSTGGYTVPNQLVNRVITLVSQYGLARQLSNVFPATSDTVWIPKGTTNTSATFVAENAEKQESDPAFTQVEVLIKKLVVLTKISDELIADSVINMIDYVVTNMARAIAQKEDETVFNGDGSASAGSITGVIPAIEAVANNLSIITPATDGWDNLTLADFQEVMGRLADYAYEGGDPVWICSNAFYHQVMNKIKAAGGGNSILDLESGFKKSFLGYEVKTSPVFAATDLIEDPSAGVADYCLFGRMDLVAAFASRQDARVKTTQEGDAFVYNQLWIRMEERFGYTVHDQGTASKAGSMILLQSS